MAQKITPSIKSGINEMTRERSTSVTSLLRIIIVKYTIGKATPKINTAVLTSPNESLPVKPVTINNIIIIAIINPKIKLYFCALLLLTDLKVSIPLALNFYD